MTTTTTNQTASGPSDAAVTALAEVAMSTAARAAGVWFTRHPEATYRASALEACLRANVKIRLPQALADAREAIDARMFDAAIATFQTTMALAGIDAAEEAAELIPARVGGAV